MGLSLETKDAMLRSQFGGQCWIGLLTEGGEEETDVNYVRQSVTLDAEGLADELANVEELRFPPYAGRSVVTGWIVFGAAGERGRQMLEEAREMRPRDRLTFDPGDLVVRLDG